MAADAETLVKHLFRDAQDTAERVDALDSSMADEDEETAKLLLECEALQREEEQYQGWLSSGDTSGEAYRLSKTLHEEHDRRVILEHEVFLLKSKLRAISGSLQTLTQKQEASGSAIESGATDILRQLERLRRGRGASTASRGRGGGFAGRGKGGTFAGYGYGRGVGPS